MRFLITCIVVLITTGWGLSQTTSSSPSGKIIYQKSLDDGRQIVVLAGPWVPPREFEGKTLAEMALLETKTRSSGSADLRMELRAPGTSPRCIWSRSYTIDNPQIYDELRVLDLVVLPDRVVWAWPGTGSVQFVETPFDGPPRYAWPPEWPGTTALSTMVVERLSAKLSIDADGLVEAKLTDSLSGVTRHTNYRQKPNQWDFALITTREEGKWQVDPPTVIYEKELLHSKRLNIVRMPMPGRSAKQKRYRYEFTLNRDAKDNAIYVGIMTVVAPASDAGPLKVLDATVVDTQTIALLLSFDGSLQCGLLRYTAPPERKLPKPIRMLRLMKDSPEVAGGTITTQKDETDSRHLSVTAHSGDKMQSDKTFIVNESDGTWQTYGFERIVLQQ